ncbi:hypothetical protein [Salegentibacter sediminis]|uniref:hypothetical protein n=1 Tax=Salegentibacter sediminis TaxID=1930251 RepID=UPI0009BD7093|nr:hypothetical protein [Salegentibacter sediminis]
MKKPNPEEVLKKKFEKLNHLEEDLVSKSLSNKKSKFNIERILYSCDDGFIILRRYSARQIASFQVITIEDELNNFLKKIPFKTKNGAGLQINLYELLKNTIGLELRIGQTIGIGNEANGIKIGPYIEIDGFVILTRKYSDVQNIEETLLDIYTFLDLKKTQTELDKKVKKLLSEIENKDFLLDYTTLELEEKEKDLQIQKKNLELISSHTQNLESEPIKQILLPNPFNICVLGEVTDSAMIREELNKFFQKLGIEINSWNIDFYNNSKLENSNLLRSLIKGQSKYNLIITGQIFHHSGKGNKKANILSELKNEKYVPHKVGGSPKDKLTSDKVISLINEYINEN